MAVVKEIHMLGGVVRIHDDDYAGISEEEMQRRIEQRNMAVYRMLEEQFRARQQEQASGAAVKAVGAMP